MYFLFIKKKTESRGIPCLSWVQWSNPKKLHIVAQREKTHFVAQNALCWKLKTLLFLLKPLQTFFFFFLTKKQSCFTGETAIFSDSILYLSVKMELDPDDVFRDEDEDPESEFFQV